jgi:hypothetical protein
MAKIPSAGVSIDHATWIGSAPPRCSMVTGARARLTLPVWLFSPRDDADNKRSIEDFRVGHRTARRTRSQEEGKDGSDEDQIIHDS